VNADRVAWPTEFKYRGAYQYDIRIRRLPGELAEHGASPAPPVDPPYSEWWRKTEAQAEAEPKKVFPVVGKIPRKVEQIEGVRNIGSLHLKKDALPPVSRPKEQSPDCIRQVQQGTRRSRLARPA